MEGYKNIAVPQDVHKRYKMFSARYGIQIMEVAERAIALLEAQIELPHPPDGQAVPVVYQQKEGTNDR